MSYTYPEALSALESIANDYIRLLRPLENAPVRMVCDAYAQTASVTWDTWQIRVNMPVRPATSIMTQNEFEDWTAYLLHELGHPTHTDKAAWVTAVQAGVSRLVNALEDVRMEKALIASGIVPNAKAVLSRLIGRKVVEARSAKWKPNARAEFGWTICVLGRAANGYSIASDDLDWINSQIKPGSTVKAVLAWAMPALDACKSTSDCVDLAKRIAAALAVPQGNQPTGPQPQPQPQPKSEEGEDEGEGEEGEEGEGEGEEGKPQGSPQSEGEGEGEEGEGKGQDATSDAPNAPEGPQNDNEGNSNAGKGGKGHGDGTTDSDEKPVTDEKGLIERGLAPEGEVMKPSVGAAAEKAVIDILRDEVINSRPKTQSEAAKRMGVNGLRLKEASAKASKQRALLARALRANETDEREGGRKAGRLDLGALSRAMAGAPNVFARREISEGYDTDVCILLDASGSMAGHNMISALEAGLVIAQAAGSVGASCTTEVFNSTGYIRAGALATKRTPNPADFGALQNAACGGTPLSAHMARAAVNQAKRAPQKRRVVFVVTDGGCDYGPNVVKRMAKYLEQTFGTVMAHVSIGTPLQGSFKAEVCVPHGMPLAEIGVDHFVKVLRAL